MGIWESGVHGFMEARVKKKNYTDKCGFTMGFEGKDASGFDVQILQQLDDIVFRSKQVIFAFLVIRCGCGFIFTDTYALIHIHNPGVGIESRHHAEIAEILNGIIIGYQQAACNLPALIYRYTAVSAYIVFLFDSNISISPLC